MEEKMRTQTWHRYVAQTVASGVAPIELLFEPIYSCDADSTVAYRVSGRVNSVICGTLMPGDYLRAPLPRQLMCDFSRRVLRKACAAACTLRERGVSPGRLFVCIPSALLYEETLFSLLREQTDGVRENMALCFDEDAMDTDTQVLTRAFSEVRAAGMTVAVQGYGAEGFPIEKLLCVCPDDLFADGRVAALCDDRERAGALFPLINFAKSLGAGIYAQELTSDAAVREFRARDVQGFLPAATYRGIFAQKKYMRLEDIC